MTDIESISLNAFNHSAFLSAEKSRMDEPIERLGLMAHDLRNNAWAVLMELGYGPGYDFELDERLQIKRAKTLREYIDILSKTKLVLKALHA